MIARIGKWLLGATAYVKRKVLLEKWLSLFLSLSSAGVTAMHWAVVVLAEGFRIDTARFALMGIVSSLFIAVVLAFFVSLCARWLRLFFRGLLVVIWSLVFLTDTFLLLIYSKTFDNFFSALLLETNRSESTEFLSQPDVLVYIAWSVVTLLGVLIACVLLLRTRIKLGRLASNWSMVLIAMVFALFGLYCTRFSVVKYLHWNLFGIDNSPALRVGMSFYDSYSVLKDVKRAVAYFKRKPLPTLAVNNSDVENVVIVLGESTARKYLHCYGFPLPTTPYIDELISDGEAVAFTDVVSAATGTNNSVPRVFSFYKNCDTLAWHRYMLLPLVMKSAGYETYWLSNQEKTSVFASYSSILASLCDSSFYTSGNENRYDEVVLPHLRKAPMGRKLFEVVHILGTHIAYSSRYPQNRYKFTSSDIKAVSPDTKYTDFQLKMISEYANAIRYNDSIVGTIIDFYRNSDALVIYFPDHGESLFDGHNGYGHGNLWFTRSTVEIPMIVWCSPQLSARKPELMGRIKDAQHRPFMTDIIPHSITNLLGIERKRSDTRYSLFSPDYNEKRPRFVSKSREDYVDVANIDQHATKKTKN